MIRVAGRWGRLLSMLVICAAFAAANLSTALGQPLSGNATAINATARPPAESGESSGENDFSSSSAADSHNPEELDVIRHYDQEAADSNPAPAPKELVGQSSPLLPKITPPAGPQPTALRLFRLIPPTIFENTVEGLDENDKQVLADNGRVGPWVLTSLSDDELEFTSAVPHSNTKVRMRLYHAVNGDILIACGVQSGESCAMELWRCDAAGRIIPMPIPDEPGISEFLAAGRVLPEEYEVSMLICLDVDSPQLKAFPLLWTPTGLGSLPLDYDVYYKWNGETFGRESIPHAPEENP